MPQTSQVIVMQPVLELYACEGFALWPVAESKPYGFLPLSGALALEEVGTAVMLMTDYNNCEPDEDGDPPPADALGSFLHGLLTMDDLSTSGGLQITDTATGTTFLPGCCNGLDDRLEWLEVLDGDGWASFGHGPSPLAERDGDVVRLTVDADRDNSPVIELPITELRHLLAGAERDLVDFLHLVAAWAALHLGDYATPVTAALCRALDLPVPGTPALRS